MLNRIELELKMYKIQTLNTFITTIKITEQVFDNQTWEMQPEKRELLTLQLR